MIDTSLSHFSSTILNKRSHRFPNPWNPKSAKSFNPSNPWFRQLQPYCATFTQEQKCSV